MKFIIKKLSFGSRISLLAKAETKFLIRGDYKIDVTKPYLLMYVTKGWENMWDTLLIRGVLSSNEIFGDTKRRELIKEIWNNLNT